VGSSPHGSYHAVKYRGTMLTPQSLETAVGQKGLRLNGGRRGVAPLV
jgi:hypothetical protein